MYNTIYSQYYVNKLILISHVTNEYHNTLNTDKITTNLTMICFLVLHINIEYITLREEIKNKFWEGVKYHPHQPPLKYATAYIGPLNF